MENIQWELVVVFRLVLAMIFGAAIGLEREFKHQVAGFKTHALVTIGAAIFMIISISMENVSTPNGGVITQRSDPARIASQVVSGIGFLGAGAILRSGEQIKGLTTAASLWAVAGVGLAVGAGMYVAASVGTVLIFIILYYFSIWEKFFNNKNKGDLLQKKPKDTEYQRLHQTDTSIVKKVELEEDDEEGSVLKIYIKKQ